MIPPSDELQSLIAQFSEFIIGKDMDRLEWRRLLMRTGRLMHPEISPPEFTRPKPTEEMNESEKIDDMMSFLLKIHRQEGEGEVIDFMNELYWEIDGADDDEFKEYPLLNQFEDAEIESITATPVHNLDKFIEAKNMPNESKDFYDGIVKDINECYRFGIYSASLVLSRKLVENLLIDIFRTKYGVGSELYYDSSRHQPHNLKTLRTNLNDNSEDFRPYAVDSLEKGSLIEDLDEIRKRANAQAHSIDVNIRKEEIDEIKPLINEVVQVLVLLYERIGNAD